MDLDVTTRCNLNCRYCYKDRGQDDMPDRVAFDAVIWLFYASGSVPSIAMNFMGGEPLLRYDLIKRFVPFARRRAVQHGKKLTIGITTNGTLLTDEILAFWKQWRIGFHTSIDGIPRIQDHNRPTVSGGRSSPSVQRNIPKILACRPKTTARCTVLAENAQYLYENYRYFRSLNYMNFALVPSEPRNWDEESVRQFEEQLRLIAEDVMDAYRSGVALRYKEFHEYCKSKDRQERRTVACGAGRNMVAIDVNGDIWPCPRWTNGTMREWRIGSIYEEFSEEARARFLGGIPADTVKEECANCIARRMCGCGCMAENLVYHGDIYTSHENQCKILHAQARVGEYFHDTLYAENCPTFMERYYPARHSGQGGPAGTQADQRAAGAVPEIVGPAG